MDRIQLSSTDTNFMQTLSSQLNAELQKAGLGDELSVGPATSHTDNEPTRGDPVTLMTVAVTAVGTGGALTVLLGKDGFLSALARVLEKYVEGRQAELELVSKDGEKIKIKGPAAEIKAILKQARR